MDFGATISRAFNIVLKHRVLWILGFLASLASGVSSAGNSLNASGGTVMPISPSGELSPEAERFFEQLVTDPELIFGALTGLLCVVLLISLVLWVISIIAQGALIGGVRQIEDEGGTTFGQAWSVGARKFWPLLGLSLLLALPVLVLLGLFLLLFGGTLIPIIVATASGDESAATAVAGSLIVLLCGGGALACVGLLYAIIAAALQTFGERAIVLENKGAFEAIGRGWEVLRGNLGNIIVLALLMFVIGLVVGFVITLVAGVLFAPTLIAAILEAGGEGSVGAGTLIIGAVTFLIGTVVSAIINALFAAFSSTVWTLAYRQFTDTSGLVAWPTSSAPLPTM